MLRLLAVMALLLLALPAAAEELYPTVPAAVVRVIDGDTFDAIARPWPGWATEARVRVLELDAPETRRPRCDRERSLGRQATAHAQALLEGQEVLLTVEGRDSFGRILAHVTLPDGRDLAEVMRAETASLHYDERDRGWCGEAD